MADFKVSEKPVKLAGTFISTWLVQDWDEETWDKELQAYKQAGMEYVIVAPAAYVNAQGTPFAHYPTQIDEYKEGYVGVNIIEATLSNCQRHGMKVLLGLNMNDVWWALWQDHEFTLSHREWFLNQITLGNQMARELYEKYYAKYAKTFCGWYWVWELWNFQIMKLNARGRCQSIAMLTDALNLCLDALTAINPNLPVLLSPFVNTQLCSMEDLKWMWSDIVKNTRFRDGDILCPQDSVGAGGTQINQLDKVMQCYTYAKSFCPGLRLWANNEDFEQADWSSTTIDRFVKQLEITSKYAQRNITFAYNNYHSPVNVKAGFHKAYLYYLKTGCIQIQTPRSPEDVTVCLCEEGVQISWNEQIPEDIAGYYIWREDELIGGVKCKARNNAAEIPELEHTFIDKDVDLKQGGQLRYNGQLKYTVKSFDFFGNLSLATEVVLSV